MSETTKTSGDETVCQTCRERDVEFLALRIRAEKAEMAFRGALDILNRITLVAPGYDWNADPLSLTLLIGRANSSECGKRISEELDYYKGALTRAEADIRERQERDEDFETAAMRLLKIKRDAERAAKEKAEAALRDIAAIAEEYNYYIGWHRIVSMMQNRSIQALAETEETKP
jgi:hypothetical protein